MGGVGRGWVSGIMNLMTIVNRYAARLFLLLYFGLLFYFGYENNKTAAKRNGTSVSRVSQCKSIFENNETGNNREVEREREKR